MKPTQLFAFCHEAILKHVNKRAVSALLPQGAFIAYQWSCFRNFCILLILLLALGGMTGCGTASSKKQNAPFFTSGSREADQRASQKMARTGEKNKKQNKSDEGPSDGTNTTKLPLFTRLGGEQGIAKIVDDFMMRALNDPRVNWERKGVKRGGFSFHRDQMTTWQSTPANVAQLKKHLIQFFALATGGPAHYEGQQIQAVHAQMHISNPEFDATVGDMKASLDNLQVPDEEQKEMLAILESTRPQIVTEK